MRRRIWRRLVTGGCQNQKQQHEAFEETIGGWDTDAIDEDQDETIEEILHIVTNWLVNHILHEDELIGE